MVPQVELRHPLVAEEDVEHAIDERRPQEWTYEPLFDDLPVGDPVL